MSLRRDMKREKKSMRFSSFGGFAWLFFSSLLFSSLLWCFLSINRAYDSGEQSKHLLRVSFLLDGWMDERTMYGLAP